MDIESGQRTELLQGCSGAPAPKAGELTSGTWWSANGERVACVTGQGDIIAAKADGTEPATLVRGECQYSLNVGWSPTGDWFACTADRELILAEPSGKPRARIGLTFTGYNVWSAAPDGESLFVQGGPVAGHGSWVFYDSRGRSLGTVADAYAGRPVDIAWEPSGKAIGTLASTV